MANEEACENPDKVTFKCSSCGFECYYEYFGKRPPFSKSVILLENAYVIRDPFSPTTGHLALGGQCCLCSKDICVAPTCSIFYTKRFCVSCVENNLMEFPEEIQKVTFPGVEFLKDFIQVQKEEGKFVMDIQRKGVRDAD